MTKRIVYLLTLAMCGLSVAVAAPSDTLIKPTIPQNIPNNADKSNSKDAKEYAEFFMDKERGWFWYEQLPEEVKEEILKKAQQAQKPKPEDEPLSPAWFRKNFQQYLDNAIQHPHDEEAMRNYLYLEKFMRDRAEIFAYQRDKAVTNDPFLDQSSRRSVSEFGSKEMNANATQNQKTLLEKIGKKSGVYYFFSGNDPYSAKQTPLVKLLEKRYGFTIVPVIIDGDVPKDFPWKNVLRNEGQAQFMGVKKIPALFLFNNTNNTTGQITQGLYSLAEVEKRTLYAGERIQIISQEEALLAKPKDLYLQTNGYIGPLGIPENAPKEFVELYSKSLGQ